VAHAEAFERAARAYASQPESPSGLPDHYILYAGRLAPEKNLPVLLDAYTQLLKTTTTSEEIPHLVLAGQGPLEGQLRNQLTPLTANRVHFLGETPTDKLAPIMAACDFLVLPSLC